MSALSILLPVLLGLTQAHSAELIQVAVIDSGYSTAANAPLCPRGHKNFSGFGTLIDEHPTRHGSNIAGLIAIEAGQTGYCIVVIKILHKSPTATIRAYINALKEVYDQGYKIVNISFAGPAPDKEEADLLRQLLDRGTTIFVAAGNNGTHLNPVQCTVFPACVDPRLIVVSDPVLPQANKGPIVDLYIDGQNKTAGGVTLTGTSQSTAIATGSHIRSLLRGP